MSDEAVTDLTRGVYRRLYGGFITGRRINKLSLNAEAWFWRVLVSVDDFGNGRADPDLCRAATAGNRRVTTRQVSAWLREMKDVGLVRFYTVKDEPFLHVVGFEGGQPAGKNGKRLKKFPLPSEVQVIPGESRIAQGNPDVSSASDTHSHTDTQDDNEDMRSGAARVRVVFDFWKEHLKHPKAILDGKRERAIAGRLKAGYSVDDLLAAVRGCKATPYNMGENQEHRIYDDIELICRDAVHVDRFLAAVPNGNGHKAVVTETDEQRALRESCTRCNTTGTEVITGKGARPCNHERPNDTNRPSADN